VILGRLALREGRIEDAKHHLIEAGRSPGSPQMDSFGPNVSLAKDLLERGEKEIVIEYFCYVKISGSCIEAVGRLDRTHAGGRIRIWREPNLLKGRTHSSSDALAPGVGTFSSSLQRGANGRVGGPPGPLARLFRIKMRNCAAR